MSIVETTRAYENWMKKHIDVVGSDLKVKHEKMADPESAFPFFRATFYHWASQFHNVCGDVADAPKLLAVGDLHIENFGTWRDAEGRLIWGVNDFDEAAPMPYTVDLVRLAASALLAIETGTLHAKGDEAIETILEGYREPMEKGGAIPFVLEEQNAELRKMAMGSERKPQKFWLKLEKCEDIEAPKDVVKLLRKQLPDESDGIRIVHRVAGLGSRGRPRYVALANWRGARVAREAKAALPPAYVWATDGSSKKSYYEKVVDAAVRVKDPFLKIKDDWIVRRLSPHCSRIEFMQVPEGPDDLLILKAMGQETANIHLGSKDERSAVCKDLAARSHGWLEQAAHKMVEATRGDWTTWRAAVSQRQAD